MEKAKEPWSQQVEMDTYSGKVEKAAYMHVGACLVESARIVGAR
jgi:hypothetical protein